MNVCHSFSEQKRTHKKYCLEPFIENLNKKQISRINCMRQMRIQIFFTKKGGGADRVGKLGVELKGIEKL